MAFDFGNNNNVTPLNSNNNFRKSQGFINLYLPTQEGGRRKLGSIGLKMDKPAEKQLLEFLMADPSRIGQLLRRLEADFQPAEGNPANGFDLSFDEETEATPEEEIAALEAAIG